MSIRATSLAREIRMIVAEAAIRAQTCHIGSALSIVDILAVLYGDILRPEDRFLLSKGHAASALYGALAATGTLTREEVLSGYCADGGRLHGHPERGVPGVEMTAGSLGHGPAIALGIALAQRRGGDGRTFCLIGDGECNEGSVWEVIMLAGHLRTENLTLIIDANGLQGLGPTAEIVHLAPLAPKLRSFGFDVTDAAGHDHDSLQAALHQTPVGRPHAVIAHTIKGYGWRAQEGDVMSHYRTMRADDRAQVLADLERC